MGTVTIAAALLPEPTDTDQYKNIILTMIYLTQTMTARILSDRGARRSDGRHDKR